MSNDPFIPGRPDPAAADDRNGPKTQIVRDRDAYLGQGAREIGRRLTEDQVEFFVNGDAPPALQREFDRLGSKFIALHDVGTTSSLRLLESMARSRQTRMQRLSIRRQGHGVALATLQFVQISAPDGSSIRAYATDVDADTLTRHQLARVLLSRSTLGVLIFGDLPPHALKASLQPLLDSIPGDSWPNRELLLMPLGPATALASHASAFGSFDELQARVTPQATGPSEAWGFIGGAWNRLHAQPAASPPPAAAPPAQPTPQPAPPAVPPLPQRPAPQREADPEERTQPMGLHERSRGADAAWNAYVQRCAAIKGIVSCCVFNRLNGEVLAHSGGRSSADLLQNFGDQLLTLAGEMGLLLGAGAEVGEAHISFPGHHLLIHTLPSHSGIVLHAVLDAHMGNPQLARAQIQRAEPPA